MPLHTPDPHGCSCRDGGGCGSPGKHPRLRHGLLDAATDPAVVRAWWRRWPDANVGVATGTVLDVCDVDTPTALRTVLDVLDVVRPAGPLVRTGYGWHLWFAPTGLASRVGLLPGVDWRGRGGYVVAPPSRHATGRRYAFVQPWTRQPLPDVPAALRRLVAPPVPPPTVGAGEITDADRYAQAAHDGEVTRVLTAPRPVIHSGQRIAAGGRNNALNLAAFPSRAARRPRWPRRGGGVGAAHRRRTGRGAAGGGGAAHDRVRVAGRPAPPTSLTARSGLSGSWPGTARLR